MRTITQIEKQYGGKRRNAINRAIRSECPGGDGLLDAMKLVDNAMLTDLDQTMRQRLTLIMTALKSAQLSMQDHVLSQ